MEIIRAILGLLIGLFFLGIIFRIAYPILIIVGALFLFTIIRSMFTVRTYQNQQKSSTFRESNTNQRNTERNNTQRSSDIIDAEYTEEEID